MSHIVIIRKNEAKLLENMVKKVKINPYKNIEPFIMKSLLAFHKFPLRIRREIMQFKQYGNQYGVLLIKGLPIDKELMPTPSERIHAFDKKFFGELWLCSFGSALGDIFNFFQEGKGDIIQNYYPTKKDEQRLSAYSSSTELEFHTETHFHKFSPDYVVITCLRQDPNKEARTTFTSIQSVLKKLTPHEKHILFGKNFLTGIYYHYGNVKGTTGYLSEPIQVLYGNPNDPFMIFDRDLIIGKTPEAHRIFEKFKKLVYENQNYIYLESGDLLIIDNKRSVHGRSSFKAFFNGKDRWIQRVLVLHDFRRAAEDIQEGERLIRTDYTSLLKKGTVPNNEFIPYERLLAEWKAEGSPEY